MSNPKLDFNINNNFYFTRVRNNQHNFFFLKQYRARYSHKTLFAVQLKF